MSNTYDNIPEELTWTNQWCVAAIASKGQYKVPGHISRGVLFGADPTDRRSWHDFETVREFAEAHPPHGLGFVLSKDDPYVCIDLDIKNSFNEKDQSKWTSQVNIDRFHQIITAFGSFTERSTSGQGFHIWVRGSIGKGAKRDGVEVYSQERFMVCTGNVYSGSEILERQDLLDLLVTEMRRGEAPDIDLVDCEETEDDQTVVSRAGSAENADKFRALWHGQWEYLGYNSQSEADAALLTMLAFYSKSNSQVLRLFRYSELGKREKATKNDYYLGRSLAKVRSIAANEQTSSAVGEQIAKALVASLNGTGAQALIAAPAQPTPAPTAAPTPPAAPTPASQPAQAPAAPAAVPEWGNLAHLGIKIGADGKSTSILPEVKNSSDISYPPGLVGEIARHIYSTSPRPIAEVSIVSALGLMAGICGRAFHIPQSGLNLYIILVGQSAIGKEAMHSGISNILHTMANSFPQGTIFADFSDYVSGPALTKAVAACPSFVNITGEFGRKLQGMAGEDKGNAVMQQLRTVMTNLYQKSGPGSVFGGLGYSDKDKNVASVSGVAYSMIGESTPGTFYDSLTDSMMADGFLSRFTVVEYTGLRPAMNENMSGTMDEDLLERFTTVVRAAYNINANTSPPCLVTFDDEAGEFLSVFNLKCDSEINMTQNEGWRQMWNRAHLKVYRIAAILAACDNHLFPVINLEHVMWAYDLIMRDINIMTRRIDSGDIGTGDGTRENKLLSLCKSYLTTDLAPSYAIPAELRGNGIVPRKYLQICTQRTSCFTTHKLGQIAALDMTIRSLVDSGYITEVPKAEMVQKHSFHGKAYRILHLPVGNAEAKAIDSAKKLAKVSNG